MGQCRLRAGVIGDARGSTVVTRLPMPTEESGAADRDRAQRPMLDRCEPVRTTIGLTMSPHEVGELQRRSETRDRRAWWHGAHGQLCGGGPNRARRSSGESGPISVWRVS